MRFSLAFPAARCGRRSLLGPPRRSATLRSRSGSSTLFRPFGAARLRRRAFRSHGAAHPACRGKRRGFLCRGRAMARNGRQRSGGESRIQEGGAAKASLYLEVTDRIIRELEQGRVPWVQPWGSAKASLGLPKNAAMGRAYSGINVLVLWG